MTCEILDQVGSSRYGGDFPLLVVDLTVSIFKVPESQVHALDVVRNIPLIMRAPCKIATPKVLSPCSVRYSLLTSSCVPTDKTNGKCPMKLPTLPGRCDGMLYSSLRVCLARNLTDVKLCLSQVWVGPYVVGPAVYTPAVHGFPHHFPRPSRHWIGSKGVWHLLGAALHCTVVWCAILCCAVLCCIAPK